MRESGNRRNENLLGLEDVQLKQTRFYQEAKDDGVQQGEKLILQRMLVHRFGELPVPMQQRLQQASAEQVEQWADRFVEGRSLEAIFADGHK